MGKVFLKKNEERRIKSGHLWIFSNEVSYIEGSPELGSLVEVFDSRNNFIASGFYNPHSLIAVRVFAKEPVTDLEKLFDTNLTRAMELRKRLYPLRNSCRLLFSESDFMPGLIIDKYNDTFVMQIYSAGIEKEIGIVVGLLKTKFGAVNIFTKNEEYFRTLEGLAAADTIYAGEMRDEIITVDGVLYKVSFEGSHKTGFYFDQCDNRAFASKFCAGKRVLDCFCNAGGFGLQAALNGAAEVTFVDSSYREIELAKENFGMNKFTCKAKFVVEDVFDFLQKEINSNNKYDVVIIDPPAFAKGKKNLAAAAKGYEKLNRLALETVTEGGIVFTSSCSYHLRKESFIEIIGTAALKSGKRVQLFYFNGASMDHPVLPAMEETSYLKFAGLMVSGR